VTTKNKPMKTESQPQWKVALDHLLLGCKLSSLEALEMFGIISFPKRICEIEKYTGIIPERKRINTIGKLGNKTHYFEYWIPQSKVSV
jgi:hypothetical protein